MKTEIRKEKLTVLTLVTNFGFLRERVKVVIMTLIII